jgi:hypothetical protein
MMDERYMKVETHVHCVGEMGMGEEHVVGYVEEALGQGRVVKDTEQAHIARGIHGLPKVSPGFRHAQPFYALRVGYARNGQNGRFRGGPPTGWVACGRLLPPWIPHAVRA